MKELLFGKTYNELTSIASQLGMPKFTAKQMCVWMYKKHIHAISEMTDISLANRAKLESEYELGLITPTKVEESADGTKKYLFPTLQGSHIESAFIPERERATLCVSSQSGCKMGCRFCATARQGFQHNLTAGEIVNQVESLPERDTLTNIVYMGMGEPMNNLDEVLKSLKIITSEWGYGWSPSRVTVSTVGILPELRRFLDSTSVHLAVSLHNPFPEERLAIMPAENAHPIHEVVELLKEYDFSHQRRVSFEYIVMKGLNDSPRHIKELCRLLNGLKCRMNLIRFHKIPDSPYFSPDNQSMIRFRDALTAKGIMTTIRSSRGEDIKAACGLLSTQVLSSTRN